MYSSFRLRCKNKLYVCSSIPLILFHNNFYHFLNDYLCLLYIFPSLLTHPNDCYDYIFVDSLRNQKWHGTHPPRGSLPYPQIRHAKRISVY